MEQAHIKDAMKRKGVGRRSRCAAIAGYLLVGTGLSLLTGCATAGKAKVETAQPSHVVATQLSPAKPVEPSVVHFTDGREGFEITESYGLSPQVQGEFDRASVLIRDGKYDTAIALLEKVIAQAPGMTAPHINIAIAYGRINKPEQAEQHLKKALEMIAGHPVASNEYGLLLRKAGRFAESRKVYEQSLLIFPEYYPLQRNLGILCDLYLKDEACAMKHYEIYSKAMPKDPQVKLWIADLQTRMGTNMTASANEK